MTMYKDKDFNKAYERLNKIYSKTRLFDSEHPELIETKEVTKTEPIDSSNMSFDEKLETINKLIGVNMEHILKDDKLLKNYVEEFEFEKYNSNDCEDEFLYTIEELSDALHNYQNALSGLMNELQHRASYSFRLLTCLVGISGANM
jgi:hypothetical protein